MLTDTYPVHRVMVIDDDQAVRTMVRRTLERAGFEIIEASTGEAGVALLAQDPQPGTITTVLCDVWLPGQSGHDTVRDIRVSWPWISVIMLTGDTDMNVAYGFIKLGICTYLLKPVLSDHLLRTVKNVSAGYAARTRSAWFATQPREQNHSLEQALAVR